jgi:3-oxoacyl-[acyl-carrier-protein] synthase II
VTSWSAVSGFGIGAQSFCNAIVSSQSGNGQSGNGQTGPASSVPDFDIRLLLGRKNTRSMDRVTGLAVLTVGRLLDGERAAGHGFNGCETGLVLGTTTGSVQSMMDFTRDSFTLDKPYLVDPARFPNAVMNRAAGQCAIWHGLRGPNATIASGQVAGLSALSYAARLHRFGHARSVLCGAVEELTPQREWLERQRQDGRDHPPLGEGCAVFRLEPADDASAGGRRAFGYLLATAFRVPQSAAGVPQALADCVSSVLDSADASAGDVWLLASDLPAADRAGLDKMIGAGSRRVGLASAVGDTGAASTALAVAAVLAHAMDEPASRERLALVASADREGLTGAAAFRLPPRPRGTDHAGH